jgi:probable rRNA maturation factor
MLNQENCTIINKTKGKLPRLPFESIKNEILGEKYELTVIFLSSKKQKEINSKYRGKNNTTNILSWPMSDSLGDISFDLQKVKADSKLFDMTYVKFLKYLFIHGCLHLKGFEHSSTMEREERKFLKKFS